MPNCWTIWKGTSFLGLSTPLFRIFKKNCWMMPKSLIISLENLSTGHGKKIFCYYHEVVLSMTMLISICRQCHKYGPIYDNVSGSIDMTNMNHEVSKTTNALNVVGNIIIIIGKVGHCCFSGSCCCHLLQMISTKLFLELML